MTEISVHFKRTPQADCALETKRSTRTLISLGIQPDEERITVKFGAKKPAAQMQMAPVQAEFCYQTAFGAATPERAVHHLTARRHAVVTLRPTRGDEVEAEVAHHHAHRRSVEPVTSAIVPELCGWDQRSSRPAYSHRRRPSSVASPQAGSAKGRVDRPEVKSPFNNITTPRNLGPSEATLKRPHTPGCHAVSAQRC